MLAGSWRSPFPSYICLGSLTKCSVNANRNTKRMCKVRYHKRSKIQPAANANQIHPKIVVLQAWIMQRSQTVHITSYGGHTGPAPEIASSKSTTPPSSYRSWSAVN
ncbi:uncharacterized protein P884DRAFT_96589 [Thermothelomyces heterothallicus CBS 202.75]|uniref:uncharacterized protein n=1 Tax=Thermothelomyces heterothallicus CBS 202.75 TaxID=1149848 RepID=UPI0037442938